ncbi:MAG: histidine phosphatase family protein [Saprospiraceae bacterium]
MTIYLIRHGETDFNRRHIVQGSGVDSSLNDTGRAQGRHFHAHYKDVPFGAVITSGLKRTAETVADFIGMELSHETDHDLNEMSWGEHEGKSSTPAMIAQYQTMKEGWERGEYHHRIPGGESAAELAERLQRFIERLRERKEDTLLICSHGRSMCALVTLMMGRPLSRMNELRHSNTGLWVAELKADGSFEFTKENDRAHLAEMPAH